MGRDRFIKEHKKPCDGRAFCVFGHLLERLENLFSRAITNPGCRGGRGFHLFLFGILFSQFAGLELSHGNELPGDFDVLGLEVDGVLFSSEMFVFEFRDLLPGEFAEGIPRRGLGAGLIKAARADQFEDFLLVGIFGVLFDGD